MCVEKRKCKREMKEDRKRNKYAKEERETSKRRETKSSLLSL